MVKKGKNSKVVKSVNNYTDVKHKLWLGIAVSVVLLVVVILVLIPLLGKKEVVGEAVSSGLLCSDVPGTALYDNSGNNILCDGNDYPICDATSLEVVKKAYENVYLCGKDGWEKVDVNSESVLSLEGKFLCQKNKEFLYCGEQLQNNFFNGADGKVYKCVDGVWMEKEVSLVKIVEDTTKEPEVTTFQVGKDGMLECVDSDKGVNFKMKGVTRGYDSNKKYTEKTDYCYESGKIAKPQDAAIGLAEYFCNAQGIVSATFAQCGNGFICRDGACVTK